MNSKLMDIFDIFLGAGTPEDRASLGRPACGSANGSETASQGVGDVWQPHKRAVLAGVHAPLMHLAFAGRGRPLSLDYWVPVTVMVMGDMGPTTLREHALLVALLLSGAGLDPRMETTRWAEPPGSTPSAAGRAWAGLLGRS